MMDQRLTPKTTLWRKAIGALVQAALRTLVYVYIWAVAASRIKQKTNPCSRTGPRKVLLTGTFYSENWILNHVRPLAASSACGRVYVVTTLPLPHTLKMKAIYPPRWLQRCIGGVPARLITFVMMGFRVRPDLVGGFHLLLNGMVAAILGRLIGCPSVYFCGGGPREVMDGGIHGSRLFGLIGRPDPLLERWLIRAVCAFDLVVAMGGTTVDYFRRHGVNSRFSVIPGGIDRHHYQFGDAKEFDLILIGRLEQVKRIDLFLRTVAVLARDDPRISAVVVGAGSQGADLWVLAEELKVQGNVHFAGYQTDVAPWLAKSRVFVLTSDSEGMPLALMEAMMSGLPCVASEIGEIAELVAHGKNGYLVSERTPEAFASHIRPLLRNRHHYRELSRSAREEALQYDADQIASRWGALLMEL